MISGRLFIEKRFKDLFRPKILEATEKNRKLSEDNSLKNGNKGWGIGSMDLWRSRKR